MTKTGVRQKQRDENKTGRDDLHCRFDWLGRKIRLRYAVPTPLSTQVGR